MVDKTRCSWDLRYGLEGHMKGRIDGFFGMLSRMKESWARKQEILQLEDLVAAWEASWKDQQQGQKEQVALKAVLFNPPPKDQ
eukprot:3599204-Prorocentrum_lima.AAC.1